MRHRLALALTLALAILASRALASGPDSPNPWDALIHRLAQDGYSEQDLRLRFSHPDIVYQPDAMGRKLKALYRTKFEPPKRSKNHRRSLSRRGRALCPTS